MHAYSRRARRQAVEPATAQDFMRFLLRWQHLAPDTQLAGDDGLTTVISRLQGWEAAAAAWEPELFARRLRHYDAAALDRLCHEGEVGWLRLGPPPREADAPVGAPNKATPISVVFRDDLGWLIEAARGGTDPVAPTVGGTAEILDALRGRGACFAVELGEATGRLPEDVERALWDGVARGLLTSDGFGAIRARVTRGAGGGVDVARLSRLVRGARGRGAAAGRWSLVPTTGADADRDELAEAVAEMLLHRWGVVFRDLALRESIRFPWRDVQRALRRLEDRGLVRGGRFVAGFSGEQFALSQAAEQLVHVRKLPRTGERVIVSATDPLNLVGTITPGATVPAIRTRRVVYVDGVAEPLPPEARTA
jgi:ATP-dependent Lhr-like helicase